MTDNSYTHMTMVVDRSGSMSSIRDDAEGGINEMLSEQKKAEGSMTLSLVQFDTEYEVIHDGVDIQWVPKYSLVPRGMTALLDAIGKAINVTDQYIKGLNDKKRPGKVIFVIVTDGHENSSREFNAAQIKDLIGKMEKKYDWDFTFIGADMDAVTVAQGMGIRNSVQYTNSAKGNRNMYAGFTQGLTATRSAVAKGDVEGSSLIANMSSSYDDESQG